LSDAPVTVLGLSALYHDAAAALVVDGEVVAAAQQERFSRKKHDPAFPLDAIRYCLKETGVAPDGLTAVAYYDKPLTTFVRILKSYVAAGPRGIRTFPKAMSEWSTHKLWTSLEIERGIRALGWKMPKELLYAEHHMSHAAAAFYPSPYERAAIVTMDGVGEWATSSIGVGRGRTVELLREQRFPDSLGLLYSAFTYHCGFRVNSGEYKLMGLAPYGEPTYVDRILEVVDLADDGSIRMDLRYFDYLAGRRMTNARFDALFDGPARDPESPITDREADLARSIQEVVERAVLGTARTARELTGETNLVLAGGVALNCVANGRLDREGPFENIWVQPAAGDAGSALGCALWAYHDVLGNPRTPETPDGMHGTYLGPGFSGASVAADLEAAGRPFEQIPDDAERAERIAGLLADGQVVAVVQGRMEFGPRALGHRSILADARDPEIQRSLNLRVKNRESFRPFAPAVLAEHASDWFDLDHPAPYMTFVAPVAEHRWVEATSSADTAATITDVVAEVRSEIPAVTHVDHSARIQTVDADQAPAFHRILSAFHRQTGCPVLVNTSFNVRGEPIVATPDDAYRCFMTTDIDHLLIEDCLLSKADQPAWDGPLPDLELD
jgi:carbamoyltransferase